MPKNLESERPREAVREALRTKVLIKDIWQQIGNAKRSLETSRLLLGKGLVSQPGFEPLPESGALDLMTWSTDAAGKVTHACPSLERYTGQNSHAARGDGWLQVVHPEDRVAVRDVFEQACRQKRAFWMVYRLQAARGNYAWVMSGAAPSHSPATHAFIGFLGSIVFVELQDDVQAHGELEPEPASNPPETEPKSRLDMLADLATLSVILAQEVGKTELIDLFDQCRERVEECLSGRPMQQKLM